MTKKTTDRCGPAKPGLPKPSPPKRGRDERKQTLAPQSDRLTQQTRKQLGKHYANKYHIARG